MLYGLKMIVSAAAIISVSVSLVSSLKYCVNTTYNSIDDLFRGYSYFQYINSQEDLEVIVEKMNMETYQAGYDKYRPIVDICILEDQKSFVLLNSNAEAIIDNLLEENLQDSDIVILYKKRDLSQYNREIVYDEISNLRFGKDCSICELELEHGYEIPVIDDASTSGIQMLNSPIIIFVKNKELSKKLPLEGEETKILYRIDPKEVETLTQNEVLSENKIGYLYSDFLEDYSYSQGFIKKIIALFSSVTTLVLSLVFILTVVINSMEYKVNALELALKKTLGYSVIEKNRKIIGISVLTNIGVFIGTCIFAFLLQRIHVIGYVAVVCCFMGVLEILVNLIQIGKIERAKIIKILKGGQL